MTMIIVITIEISRFKTLKMIIKRKMMKIITTRNLIFEQPQIELITSR